jgi:alanyl-tRNA synthetase
MKTDLIRTKYLNFFKERAHALIKSDSLIPVSDPSLLFTGAGMNQFKEYFLGLKKDFTRATSSQKCLRTGDLENVGKTPYHHTFFEMLGNFSFGDYFKKDAICWAWEFLTVDLGIKPGLLRVSVHREDEESFRIWKDEVGIDQRSIFTFGDKDNFWPANAPADGPNGPCGPCSEIFYDQGAERGCQKDSCSPACDCGRFAEIWNLVFTQYERKDGGILENLPSKNIDTGMGLERIACVLQGKRTNYEIDIFEDLIAAICAQNNSIAEDFEASKRSVYAIVDHIRAAVFAISDGAYPSNEGRGYVIRKLIRRCVWHADTIGIKHVFLESLVPIIITTFKQAYPELEENRDHVCEIIRSEENRFRTTLEDGRRMLEQKLEEVRHSNRKTVSGEVVFRLYDTYGFPDELTRMRAEEEGFSIDQAEFDRLMAEQREKAKSATEISSQIFSSSALEKHIATLPNTHFCGYDNVCDSVRVISIFKDTAASEHISAGDTAFLIFDSTPFYAESGGQIGDRGVLKNSTFEAEVINTQKKDEIFYHEVIVTRGALAVGDTLEACVDIARREAVMRNHTATHILQAALRTVLGSHVRQLGSLVTDEKLRFDFSYQKALTPPQLTEIEKFVNDTIAADISLATEQTSVSQAKQKGALAFFGDRYGERVRLVSIGDLSKELCGGTHCPRTGAIARFKIISEASIASGIRRIEALTASAVDAFERSVKEREALIAAKQNEKKKVAEERQTYLESLKKPESVKDILARKKDYGEYALISHVFHSVDQGGLREIFDLVKTQTDRSIVAFLSDNGDTVAIVVALTPDLQEAPVSAVALIKEINGIIDGKGGGKKMMAFSGAPATETSRNVLKEIPEIVNKILKN